MSERVMIPEHEYQERIQKAAKLVAEKGLDVLIVNSNEAIRPNSCLDLAKDLIGSVEGPSDLSFNKKYLKGYGQ